MDLKREIERLETEKINGKPRCEEDEDDDPMNDSMLNPVKGTHEDKGTTIMLNFKFSESIFVLERREFQKKAAVFALDAQMNMT